MGLLCLCGSCSETETLVPAPVEGNILTVSYKIPARNLKVGDTFIVNLERETDSETGVTLDFNGEETTITEFPYSYKKVLSKSGTYKLTLKEGPIIFEYDKMIVKINASIVSSVEYTINVFN